MKEIIISGTESSRDDISMSDLHQAKDPKKVIYVAKR
jgi:hypothetical protein